MGEQARDVVTDICQKIGQEVVAIVGDRRGVIYLYAEVEPGVVGAEIFQELDDHLRYHDFSDYLGDLITDLWEVEKPDRRWVAMEYEINGSEFSIDFLDEDEVVKSDGLDWRDIRLRRRFGDKPDRY